MLTTSTAIAFGKKELQNQNALLDSEILLTHILKCSRATLHAWPDKAITTEQEKIYRALLARAKAGEPIAYLTSKKEFWSLELKVDQNTLIPRPETELLIEIILENFNPQSHLAILDLGTGSGAIALALAKEKPEWEITATDISHATLAIAKQNAENFKFKNIFFLQSNWFDEVPAGKKFDVIVSNPPYIAKEDDACDPAVKAYEPHLALFSENQGLQDITKIISRGSNFLKPNGFMLIEHSYQQALSCANIFKQNGYENIRLYQDLSGQDRATSAYYGIV